MAIVLVRSQLMQHLHVTPQRAPARTEGNEADVLRTRRRGRSTRVENVARTDEPSRRHARGSVAAQGYMWNGVSQKIHIPCA